VVRASFFTLTAITFSRAHAQRGALPLHTEPYVNRGQTDQAKSRDEDPNVYSESMESARLKPTAGRAGLKQITCDESNKEEKNNAEHLQGFAENCDYVHGPESSTGPRDQHPS
jgi:hypothetical protein